MFKPDSAVQLTQHGKGHQSEKNGIHRRGTGREKKSLFAKISSCKYLISFRQNLQFFMIFEFFLMTTEYAENLVSKKFSPRPPRLLRKLGWPR
jgi:hypothetical protein